MGGAPTSSLASSHSLSCRVIVYLSVLDKMVLPTPAGQTLLLFLKMVESLSIITYYNISGCPQTFRPMRENKAKGILEQTQTLILYVCCLGNREQEEINVENKFHWE